MSILNPRLLLISNLVGKTSLPVRALTIEPGWKRYHVQGRHRRLKNISKQRESPAIVFADRNEPPTVMKTRTRNPTGRGLSNLVGRKPRTRLEGLSKLVGRNIELSWK
jgi:hypothetical protein